MEKQELKNIFYTLKFPPEMNAAFKVVQDKLGFGKAECIRRAVLLLADLANDLKSGREIVFMVREEMNKKPVKGKVISFDALRSPSK